MTEARSTDTHGLGLTGSSTGLSKSVVTTDVSDIHGNHIGVFDRSSSDY